MTNGSWKYKNRLTSESSGLPSGAGRWISVLWIQGSPRGRRNSAGHTIIELVVILVAVVALAMVSILGIAKAREASRRSQCQANLRQIGLALQSYHQTSDTFPPAVIQFGEDIKLAGLSSLRRNYLVESAHANWAILLLPHLGLDALAGEFNPGATVFVEANARVRTAVVPVMRCGSDDYSNVDNPFILRPAEGGQIRFARGNYGINTGVQALRAAPGDPWNPVPNGPTIDYLIIDGHEAERRRGSGIAGVNASFSIRDFENGLSNTVGIDELRAGVSADDPRGVWALGRGGSSTTGGHGLIGDCVGPNSRHPRSDDIIGCNQLREQFGRDTLVEMGMPCCPYVWRMQATSRSMHPDGVNVQMMDGSTRFVRDDVDRNLWHMMHSRLSRETESIEPVVSSDNVKDGENRLDPFAPNVKERARERAALPVSVHSRSTSKAVLVNSIGMQFVRIAAGEFIMGLADLGKEQTNDPIHGTPPDVPPHRVRISRDFFMGIYEVTQGQYEAVTGVNPSLHVPSNDGEAQPDGQMPNALPVEQVSWLDATGFCRSLSELPEERRTGRTYRLPTEAEWEYCCRAGSEERFRPPAGYAGIRGTGFNVYPSGPRLGTVRELKPVGSFPPNAFGLYDMRGNVFEWCADWFAWDYYLRSPEIDPQGPENGVLRIVRGADWRFTNMGCNLTRYDTEPWQSNPFIGFRVACQLPPELDSVARPAAAQ